MLTASEIAAGSARLVGNKLSVSDVETLVSTFRLFLKNRFNEFSGIAEKLAELTDSGDDRTAAKCAAILTKLEETGFGVLELRGDVNLKDSDQISFYIRFCLGLLKYESIEGFSGSVESSGANVLGSSSSTSVPIENSW
jgi:hypothetical protein